MSKLFDTCPDCGGSGFESQAGNENQDGEYDVVCHRCGGHGEIVLSQPGPQAPEEDHDKFADRIFAALFGPIDEGEDE